MLTIPEFARLEEFRTTAYVDSSMWWKFYLIPDGTGPASAYDRSL